MCEVAFWEEKAPGRNCLLTLSLDEPGLYATESVSNAGMGHVFFLLPQSEHYCGGVFFFSPELYNSSY